MDKKIFATHLNRDLILRKREQLLPQPGSSATFLEAIQAAQERFPYVAFESQMLDFLEYLHDGLVKPDLIQVEERRISIHGNELPEADSACRDQDKRTLVLHPHPPAPRWPCYHSLCKRIALLHHRLQFEA